MSVGREGEHVGEETQKVSGDVIRETHNTLQCLACAALEAKM